MQFTICLEAKVLFSNYQKYIFFFELLYLKREEKAQVLSYILLYKVCKQT